MTYSPENRTTRELLADWAAIMRALRHRDVIRTNNSPIGDIAEAVVATHYGGTRGSFSQAGWDVLTPAGERIQVKALRTTSTGKRTNLSPIRDADYDYLLILIFDEDFNVTEALRLSRATVERLYDHNPYVNGRIVRVTRRLRADPEVEAIDLSSVLLPGEQAQ